MAGPFDFLGGLGAGIGAIAGQGDQQKQQQYQDAAIQALAGLAPVPTLQQLGPSAFQGINANPALQAAEMQALAQYGQMANGGGYTPGQRAQIQGVQQQQAQATNSGNQAIQQDMERRGMGNSGLALAAQLQNSQGQADRANQFGSNIAAQGAQNAINAMGARANLAGNMQQQQYDMASQKAAAADAIARFNQQLPVQQWELGKEAAQARAGGDMYGAQAYGQRYGQDVNLGSAIGGSIGSAGNLGFAMANPSGYGSLMGTMQGPRYGSGGYGYGFGGG